MFQYQKEGTCWVELPQFFTPQSNIICTLWNFSQYRFYFRSDLPQGRLMSFGFCIHNLVLISSYFHPLRYLVTQTVIPITLAWKSVGWPGWLLVGTWAGKSLIFCSQTSSCVHSLLYTSYDLFLYCRLIFNPLGRVCTRLSSWHCFFCTFHLILLSPCMLCIGCHCIQLFPMGWKVGVFSLFWPTLFMFIMCCSVIRVGNFEFSLDFGTTLFLIYFWNFLFLRFWVTMFPWSENKNIWNSKV